MRCARLAASISRARARAPRTPPAAAPRAGSLLLPFLLHVLNNGIALAAAALAGGPGCAPAPRTPATAAALGLSLAIYAAAAAWMLAALAGEVASRAGAAAFRARHTIAFAYATGNAARVEDGGKTA